MAKPQLSLAMMLREQGLVDEADECVEEFEQSEVMRRMLEERCISMTSLFEKGLESDSWERAQRWLDETSIYGPVWPIWHRYIPSLQQTILHY